MTSSVTMHPDDLDPSRVGARTYVTRRRITRVDAASIISILLCVLLLMPARLIVPGATDVGRPALMVGVLMFGWWLLARLNPRLLLVGPQPLRWAVLAFVLSLILSYAVGMLRGLTTMEANSADRWLIAMAAFIGLILTTADGLPNWARLRGVLSVFVWCSAFVALVALVQVASRVDVTQLLAVPILESKGFIPSFEERGSGLRVASTTGHYIELSAVMAIALPFAIHLARFAASRARRRAAGVASVLIAVAIPATVSRTGIVALAIAIVAMMTVWSWRLRLNVIVIACAVGVAAFALLEDLFDTFVELFAGAATDPSITSRTERYAMVADYFTQRPWFGRGTGTWLHPQYQYLDNQWLAFALMNGLIGVAALLTLHATAIALAVIALRRSTSEETRHLCAALISSQLVAIAVGFFFDSLSFYTYVMVLALCIGLCGAVWRFTHPAREIRTSATSGLPSNKTVRAGADGMI